MKHIQSIRDFKIKQTKNKIFIILLQISIFILFLGCWELFANIGLINEFLVSKPSAIYSLFIKYLESGELKNHVFLSVVEMFIGLIIGTVGGLIIAIILYLIPFLYKVLDPYLVVLNALPKTALAPIIIIWIGTGINGIIAVSITLSIVITIISCYTYFSEVLSSNLCFI